MKKAIFVIISLLLIGMVFAQEGLISAQEEILKDGETLDVPNLPAIEQMKLSFQNFQLKIMELGNKIGLVKGVTIAQKVHAMAQYRLELVEFCKQEYNEPGKCISDSVKDIKLLKGKVEEVLKGKQVEEINKAELKAEEEMNNNPIPRVKTIVTLNENTGETTTVRKVIRESKPIEKGG